jgi:hypothetical protein
MPYANMKRNIVRNALCAEQENMRTIIPLALLCLVLSLLPGCHKETEQDKVKKIITNIQKATEEKDRKKIVGSISKTYNDPQNNNYESVNRLVFAYFYQYPKISVYITKLDISVKDESAKAVIQTVLTSRDAAGSAPVGLPESLGAYVFDVLFRKESDEWKVVSATWERIGNGN